jgi:hypothetical protein
MNPIIDLFNLSSLYKDRGASTLSRLWKSPHVADLRLIILIIIIFSISTLIGLLSYFPLYLLVKHFFHLGFSLPMPSATLIAAILTVTLGSLAKLYQMGSARLGVVDLFGCEISTICRVVVVTEATTRMINLYHSAPSDSIEFNSEEKYSPVFDDNVKELEILEARVVERVTEFYTYLKTVRDYRRALANIKAPKKAVEIWQASVKNIIYMMFLMLESARLSVDRLVEYLPEKVQYTTEILLSELTAYSFLLTHCRNESVLIGRLKLRMPGYEAAVQEIQAKASDQENLAGADGDIWAKVTTLLDELDLRYSAAMRAFDNFEPAANALKRVAA